MTNKKTGKFGEFIARCFLRLKGYRILEKNYVTGRKTTAGEIDIIALKGKTLVFVEVKTRKKLTDALYALSFQQQQRVMRGALCYLKSHKKYARYGMRFDAVFFAPPLHIKHIANAWGM